MSKQHEVNEISLTDATAIVKHYMGLQAIVASETHIKALARNILRSRNMGVSEALEAIRKRECAQPKMKAF